MHPLYKYPKFLAKSIEQRVMIVSERNLCIRCLRQAHEGLCPEKSSNNPCNRCKPDTVYHNSTLCDKNTYTVTPIKKVVIQNDDDWE